MTALTVPARPGQDAGLRPVPWRRMAWVTWRQHRTALGGVVVALGAWAVFEWLTGLRMHHAYAAVAACRPAGSIACGQMADDFYGAYRSDVAVTLIQAAPALIGAFVGAPVLARELETGTFRYAWTQGIGRWRWTLAKLVPLAIAMAAVAAACSLLFSWYYEPFFAGGQQTSLAPAVFDLRGAAFAAWTLAAFAIGALAGMLIRRVVPAMAATLAVYAGLAVATGAFLRQHYMTPLVTSNWYLPSSAWIVSERYTKDGHPVSTSAVHQAMLQYAQRGPDKFQQTFDPVPYLIQHGYALWSRYQPGSRFWPFQWIEAGWLLALSLLLFAVTVWLVRRRAA